MSPLETMVSNINSFGNNYGGYVGSPYFYFMVYQDFSDLINGYDPAIKCLY